MTTKNGKAFPIPVRAKYSCSKCPAYCCSYPEIEVTSRDIERLAKHFELSYRETEQRFTKYDAKQKITLLRHREDKIFDSVCAVIPTARAAATTSSSSSSAPTRTTRSSLL
jgi:hypothetical protein